MVLNKDSLSVFGAQNALNLQNITGNATTAGIIIDTQGFGSITFVIKSGDYTDGTFTPLIEAGDQSNLSDAAAIADTALLPVGTGQEAAAALSADNSVKKIGCTSLKRYIRLSIVSSGVSTGSRISAVAILGNPDQAPVA